MAGRFDGSPKSAGNTCSDLLAAKNARHPVANASMTAGIYRQALLLWWKGADFHPHPGSDIEAELQP